MLSSTTNVQGLVVESAEKKEIAENTKVFASHVVWVGPHRLPLKAIFSLHTKAMMFTQEHQEAKGFIPVICLNNAAVANLHTSFVPLELIKIDACPLTHLHLITAARKLDAEYILKINLNGNVAYMPVLIWEDLQSRILKALKTPDLSDSMLKLPGFLGSHLEEIRLGVETQYFGEDAMATFLMKDVIEFLLKNGLYVAASDIVRLLLLAIQPGCYVDIADIELKKLPAYEDFKCPFMTRNNENDLIVSLDPKIIINIIMAMYIRIRKAMKEPIEDQLLIPDLTMIIKAKIDLYCKDFILFSQVLKVPSTFVNREDKTIKEYIHKKEFFVNKVAGFHFWINVVSLCNTAMAWRYLNGSNPTIPETLFPIMKQRTSEFSWNTPGLSFIERLVFLAELITQNSLYNIFRKEIDDICQQYLLSPLEVINMSLFAELIRTKNEISEMPKIVVEIQQKATLIWENFQKNEQAQNISDITTFHVSNPVASMSTAHPPVLPTFVMRLSSMDTDSLAGKNLIAKATPFAFKD